MADQLLNEGVTRQVKQAFEQLQQPVQVLFFGKKSGCEYCDDTHQLVEEVVGLSDKLSLRVYDLDDDAAVAKEYKVDKAPGLVITGGDGAQAVDYGVRIAGIPAGHEFTSLIHDLLLVSGRDSGLAESTRQFLDGLTQPVHLQVFVTPT
jgi:alkyl hydroperoxide reductase subunit AhpF